MSLETDQGLAPNENITLDNVNLNESTIENTNENTESEVNTTENQKKEPLIHCDNLVKIYKTTDI